MIIENQGKGKIKTIKNETNPHGSSKTKKSAPPLPETLEIGKPENHSANGIL